MMFKQPLRDLPAYTNRKSVTSVKLQAVCDFGAQVSNKFLISCGWPGSMHDARIFRISFLGHSIKKKLQETPYHILGDSAYPIGIRLMNPYRDNGHLTHVYFQYSDFGCYLNLTMVDHTGPLIKSFFCSNWSIFSSMAKKLLKW